MRRAAFAAPLLALLAAAPAAGAGPVRNAEAVHLTGGPNAGRVLLVVRARYKRGARTRRDRLRVRLRDGARTIASASFSFVVPHGRGGTLAIHHRRLLGPATSRRLRPTSALRLVTVAPGASARAANSGTEVDQTTGPGTFLPAAQYCLQSCSTVLDTFLETGGSPWLGGLTSGAFNWVSVQWSPFSLTPLACSATSCAAASVNGSWWANGHGGAPSWGLGSSPLTATFAGDDATVDAGSGPPGVPAATGGVPRGVFILVGLG